MTRSVLLSSIAKATGTPFGPFYILQESLALAFKKLYPGDWLEGLAIPFVEDLVNQHPLDLYIRWRHQQGLDMEGSWNPVLAAPSVRQKMRTAEASRWGPSTTGQRWHPSCRSIFNQTSILSELCN